MDLSVLDDLSKFENLTEVEQAELLERMAEAKGATAVPKDADKADSADETVEATATAEAKPDDPPEEPKAEEKPPHGGFVPKQRFKEVTRQKQAAEQAAHAYYQRAQELEAQLAAVSASPVDASIPAEVTQAIAEMRESYGEDAVKPMDKIAQFLTTRLAQVEREARMAGHRATKADVLAQVPLVQEQASEREGWIEAEATARAQNPYISHWEKQGGRLWDAVREADALVAQSPILLKTYETRGVDAYYQKRYDMVAEHIRDEFGIPKIDSQPALDPKQVRAQAEAKLKDDGPRVRTLSDIPAGATPPIANESERIGKLSSSEVYSKMGHLPPDKIFDWLEAQGHL